MKKSLIVILLLTLVAWALPADVNSYEAGSLTVRAYSDYTATLKMEPNLSNMPFDVTSDQVQPADDAITTTFGLIVGTWSLFTNLEHVSLDISCTNLVNGTSKIPYYLQVSYPIAYTTTGNVTKVTYGLLIVTSDDGAKTLTLPAKNAGYYDVKYANFYVRLKGSDYSSANIGSKNLASGAYTSTITMVMTAS